MERKTSIIGVPVTPTQAQVLRDAATAQGMPLATWMRRAVLAMAVLEAQRAHAEAGKS